MKKTPYSLLFILSIFLISPLLAQKKKKVEAAPAPSESIEPSMLSGLAFRSIGPALTSGRVADFAVNPQNPHEYYVAAASGGVWKTTNAGVTYEPVFDGEGSYSIGVVTLEPGNSNVVWVGTGENNGQRSVGYGDGVYLSRDGGKSWKKMGLENSEHIGRIIVHPTNPAIVYVAAQGPLWSAGGDRGLYKTTNGGESWEKVLAISEHTGVSDLVMDPNNPEVLYASAWQRRRHVHSFISGGPESAIYKTTDGGKNWRKLTSGLPAVDLGRIGLAMAANSSDIVYAIVEAADDKGGFFRSTNRGETWEKQSSFSTSGNYYQEIIADPVNPDRVYAMDTWGQVTNDGGKTWSRIGNKARHVDDHAIWINPANTNHFLIGCDGGIYESFDLGSTFHFKPNLPITQFYKVALDQASPFYNVYGGTQDNFSLGGPARTTNTAGIVNDDWFITNGGDGFESQVDPENPNIVYAQSQYGGLVRFDKQSGESVFIQPQEKEGEEALRWNWDAPLLVSPHQNSRLYFAANKLFRSDDRGSTWKVISPDLSRGLDRQQFEVMGQVQSVDAVARNGSTTIYGNIVALDESAKQENLLYVGTDDGLIHITEDAGGSWRKVESVPGVPARTYVNMLLASRHDANVVYAAFNNHKNGDFKPYLYKSTDKGASWASISGNLPARGSVYAIAEDHLNPALLFAGTEFGLFTSVDGGASWSQLKSGLPTVAIRDIAIQTRENDLVVATFGRGFYVLDDYSPLREMTKQVAEKEAHLFAIKEGLMFIEAKPLGLAGKSFQGEQYFTTPNPPVAATFSFFLKEGLKTQKEKRQEKEKELMKSGQKIPFPSFEELRAEDAEEAPYLLFTVTDAAGEVVRKIKKKGSKGMQRVTWDFRYAPVTPIDLSSGGEDNPFNDPETGPLALPGQYDVQVAKVENGEVTPLIEKTRFSIKPLNNVTLPANDKAALLAFQQKVSKLRRAVRGASMVSSDVQKRLKYLKEAVLATPQPTQALMKEVKAIEKKLTEIRTALNGDRSLSARNFETVPSITARVENIVYGLWNARTAPTTTQEEQYQLAGKEFKPVLASLKELLEKDLKALEVALEQAGAPYTPGRMIDWMLE